MRNDVDAPFLEVRNLVLSFTDDDANNCFFQPQSLALQPCQLFCCCIAGPRLRQRGQSGFLQWKN